MIADERKTMVVAVVDDEPMERKRLAAYIKAAGWQSVDCFASGDEFLKGFNDKKYGLVFMDILMDGRNGVEIVKVIRKASPRIFIAFVTGSTDFAMEAYRLHVNRYIEKPFDQEEVREILEEAQEIADAAPAPETVDFGGLMEPVEPGQIVCIEQQAHMAVVYLSDGSSRKIREKISVLLEYLEDRQEFHQFHKSFIVNIAHVTGIDEDLQMFLTDIGKNVHIRRRSMGEARRTLKQYLDEMEKDM